MRISTTWRSRIAVLGLGFGVIAGTFATPALAAGPSKPDVAPPSSVELPAGFTSLTELLTTQRNLNAVADRLKARLGAHANFAGIVVPVEKRQIRLYWKGAVPASVRATVEAARGDVAVTVHGARFSQRQLTAAQSFLMRRAQGASGVTLHTIGVRPDGSGLAVSASGSGAAALLQTEPTVVARTTSRPSLATRIDDSAPYWGGARWTSGGSCTTGFGIVRPSDGREFMLSAGHCAANGNTARDGGGQVMGTVTGDNNGRDWLLIQADTGGRIYQGQVNASGGPVGESSLRVSGWAANHPGNVVCTNGSYSGTRCNVQVTATNQSVFFGDVGYWVTGLIEAQHTSGGNAGGKGDSGDGVFSYASTTTAYAHGIFTGMDGNFQVPCTGVPTGGGRWCSSKIWYSDIGSALTNYGAWIQVE